MASFKYQMQILFIRQKTKKGGEGSFLNNCSKYENVFSLQKLFQPSSSSEKV